MSTEPTNSDERTDTETTFDFEAGDAVAIRIRTGDSNTLTGKFAATCTETTHEEFGGDTAHFDLEVGTMNTIKLRSYEAEFERLDSLDDVQF